MDNHSLIPSGPNNLSKGSIFDQAASGMTKRLQFLQGKEGAIGAVMQILMLGAGGLWLYRHIGDLGNFMDAVVHFEVEAIYAVAGALVFVGLWLLLGSQKVRYEVAMVIDMLIAKIHRWIINRDKFGAAQYFIRKLEESLQMAREALARVYAVFQKVVGLKSNAQKAAEAALRNAQGFEQEINRRAAGGKPTLQLSDEALQRSFRLAKSSLRVQYELFQREGLQADLLEKRCAMLRDVIAFGGEELDTKREELKAAKESFEIALESMQALQSTDDIVNSQQARDYNDVLDGISKDTESYNGRILMLMDKLGPEVENYHMGQAANQLADEQLYSAFLQETNSKAKPETQRLLLAPTSKPALPEIELMLSDAPVAPKVAVPVSASSRSNKSNQGASQFDEFFDGK